MMSGVIIPEIPGYVIEKKLGRGGMADVYLGVQEALGRKVAIKVLNPEMTQNSQLLQRFMNEARTASSLQHPNIITIHDVGQTGNYCYIVMEYLSSSLVDKIKSSPRHRMDPQNAIQILSQLAQALAYAHNEGFIHRDIKPDNIMFRKDHTPVLVDFGIARALDSDHSLTTTGMIIGTPHYMSPEQCRGEKIDGQSDIYSLGVVFYEMLTGEIPYKADSAAGILVKHIQAPIPKLQGDLSKYQSLLNGMLAKEKSDRIRSGEELVKILTVNPQKDMLNTIEAKAHDHYVFDDDSTKLSKPAEFDKITSHDNQQTKLSPLPKTNKNHLNWIIAGATLALVLITCILYFLFILPAQERKKENSYFAKKQDVTVEEKAIVSETNANPAENTSAPTTEKENPTNNTPTVETVDEKKPGTAQDKQEKNEKNKQEDLYTQWITLASQYIENNQIDKANEALKKAKAIKNTPEVKTLEKEIANLRAEAENNEKIEKNKRAQEAALKAKEERTKQQRKKDDDAYKEALSTNTFSGIERYLKLYPNGIHAAEAQQRLNQMKSTAQVENKVQDDIAFETATKTNTLDSYQAYLKRFPLGAHHLEAKSRIAYLTQKLVRETKIKVEIVSVRFFEAGRTMPSKEQRKYTTNFYRDTARFIFTELYFKNKFFGIAPSNNRITLEYKDAAGTVIQVLKGTINPEIETEDGYYSRGSGWETPGKWQPGAYTVTVYLDDQEVKKARFEIQ